jgi:phage-related protein
MADEKVIVEIGAQDNASGVIDDVADKTEGMGSKIKASFAGAEDASKKFALALAGIGAAAAAFGISAVSAYNEAAAIDKKLETLVLNQEGQTLAHVAALQQQADALERVGIIGGDVIKSAQAQLTTFDLSAEAVQTLIPSFMDLIAAEKGFNATTDDALSLANGLGKVLQGQTSALSKQGFIFDAATEHILKHGTEMEKVTALSEILGSTYNNLNQEMKKTFQGELQTSTQFMGKFMELSGEMIANAIQPMITAFNSWVDAMGGPEGILRRLIEIFKIIQPYWFLIAGAIIGALLPAFGALALAIWASVGPLLPFAAAGAAVAAVAYLIYEAYQTNFLGFQDIVTTVVNAIIPIIQQLIDFWYLFVQEFQAMLELFKFAWETNMYGIQDIVTAVWGAIQLYFTGVWEIIKGIFKIALGIITLDWKKTWDGIKDVASGIFKIVQANVVVFWEGLKLAWKVGGDLLAVGWDALMNGISSVASRVWEGIKNTFKEGINAIIKFVNGFINTYNNAVSKVPGGKNLQLPTFTPLAEGGIVTRPTFALIGEAGPEAVIPLNSSRAGGMGGGVTVVISGNSFYGDDEEFVGKIGDSIMRMLEPHLSYS